jgi:excisionase family DNA binding protein
MSHPRRPAANYVHGLDGPTVVVPAWFARWLELHTDLDGQRVNRRGMDPAVDEVLVALHFASMHAASAHTSAPGSARPPAPEVPQDLPVTVSELAERVGITGRAVRHAITAGRLPAHRVADRWLIDRADAETYRRTRAA